MFTRNKATTQAKMKRLIFILVLVAIAAAGCQPVQTEPEFRIVNLPDTSLLNLPATRHYVIGRSVENRLINLKAFGNGLDTILVIGAIHGDEPASYILANQLIKYLTKDQSILNDKKVLVIPVANPDGLANNTRENVKGVDINRNFDTYNRINIRKHGFDAMSEPETQCIADIIQRYKPVRILSIHQPYECIDFDGPALQLAIHMSKFTDLPVKKIGALPGSLGSYAGNTLTIPIITMEIKENDQRLDPEQLWKNYRDCVLAFITYPKNPPKIVGVEKTIGINTNNAMVNISNANKLNNTSRNHAAVPGYVHTDSSNENSENVGQNTSSAKKIPKFWYQR